VNTKLLNSAAEVIVDALARRRTAIGVAIALDSAQMLTTPETAVELERLRREVAELKNTVLRLNTLRGDVALLIERERAEGEDCVDIADLEAALMLGADEAVAS
jgi:hypothetical protein